MVPEPPRHRADAPGSWGHSHAPNAHDASSLPPSQLKRLDYHPGKGVGLFLAKLDRIKERYYFETEHETSVLFYAPKIRVREGSRAGRPHPRGRQVCGFQDESPPHSQRQAWRPPKSWRPGREAAGWGCWAAPGPLTCAACLSGDPPGRHRVRRPQACRAASAGRELRAWVTCWPAALGTLTHAHTRGLHTHTVNPRKDSKDKEGESVHNSGAREVFPKRKQTPEATKQRLVVRWIKIII